MNRLILGLANVNTEKPLVKRVGKEDKPLVRRRKKKVEKGKNEQEVDQNEERNRLEAVI